MLLLRKLIRFSTEEKVNLGGVKLDAKAGTNVYAIFNGKVVFAD